MKNIYIVLLVAIALFSCYDDKGNDDYKELEEVEVVLPDETYNRSFGEKLQITPTVTTSIPENDLMFDWEFYGSLGNWWSKYVSVYQGKVMDFTCVQDDTLLKNDGTYKLRLNVTQQSTGRHFYSNVVSVNLVSQVSQLGALVLHGDGTSSDMGVIVAEEFQLTASRLRSWPRFFRTVIPMRMAGRGLRVRGCGTCRCILLMVVMRLIILFSLR